MSPLLADQILIVMTTRLVTVVRTKPVTGRVAGHVEIPVQANTGAGDWRLCLEKLAEHLRTLKTRNSSAKLVLANDFLQYLLIPKAGLSSKEIDNYMILKHYFYAAYGADEMPWDFAADQGTTKSDPLILASAVESTLIAAIQAEVKAAGLRLTSVQPSFVVGVNRWRKHLQSGLHWLVMVDFESACVSLFRDGRCIHIKRLSGFRLSADALADVVQREKLLADVESTTDEVLLYTPYQPWTSIPASENLRIRRIRFAPGPGLRAAGVDVPVALAA